MKLYSTFAALFAFSYLLPAQINQQPQNQNNASYQVTERGANHRMWSRVALETNVLGKVRSRTNSYTEIETGMHFRDEKGEWQESKAEIRLDPKGAVADQGPHKVIFAPNINTGGAIDLTTADGKRFRSHVIGLSYFDTATGKSTLIAEVKDSIGELLPPNQVIYADVFTDFKADIRYTYTKAGFEQDIIFRERPLTPEDYGLNPETTRLQVLTEFLDPPIPLKKQVIIDQKQVDEVLDFGEMKIGEGKAFAQGEDKKSIPVQKYWQKLNDRDFLIEEVKFQSMATQLKELPQPEHASIQERESSDLIRRVASAKRLLPEKKVAKLREESSMQVAALRRQDGFVIDYSILSSSSNFTFTGDTTYYITNSVILSGSTVLEGGTVIKFGVNGSINLSGTLDCKTAPYRPAVFTSKDDDSIGEIISGSSGTPVGFYGNGVEMGLQTFHDLRFSYANQACIFSGHDAVCSLTNVQFINCSVPINCNGDDNDINLNNVLFHKIGTLIENGIFTLNATHITVNQCDTLTAAVDNGSGSFLNLTNSLLVAVTNLGNVTLSTNNSYLVSTSNGVFQTVGAASHYLADNSPYRNSGTTNIDAALLAELRKKTTYPPIVIPYTYYTNDLNLAPQAQRDEDIPDLGYHYDPLDYALGGVYFTNALVTVQPGTAIGTFSSIHTLGFSIHAGAEMICEGGPTSLNYIVNYNTVQEQSNTNWIQSNPISFYSSWISGVVAPKASFRFTVWSMMAGAGIHFYALQSYMPSISFRDCQFHGGIIDSEAPSFYMTNNLLDRVNFALTSESDVLLKNNTFYGGAFTFLNDGTTWGVYNNLFAHTTNTQYSDVTNDFNAFYDSANITVAGASNVILTNLTFEVGPLGDFYLATNNIQLLNTGSTNADLLTFYHYTTTTNQVKETNSIVDIGFHYVAVTNGVPTDSDGDGIPDYLEDGNGNGDVNSGETDWNSASDMGLKVWITEPNPDNNLP